MNTTPNAASLREQNSLALPPVLGTNSVKLHGSVLPECNVAPWTSTSLQTISISRPIDFTPVSTTARRGSHGIRQEKSRQPWAGKKVVDTNTNPLIGECCRPTGPVDVRCWFLPDVWRRLATVFTAALPVLVVRLTDHQESTTPISVQSHRQAASGGWLCPTSA